MRRYVISLLPLIIQADAFVASLNSSPSSIRTSQPFIGSRSSPLSSTSNTETEPPTETNAASIQSLSSKQSTREELLDKALSRYASSSSAATALLDELSAARKQDESKVEELLQELLSLIPPSTNDDTIASNLPWWTKIPLTSKISRRARRASLRRVLEYSTPNEESSKNDATQSTTEGIQRRQRRTLVNILRSLANVSTDTNGKSSRKKYGIRTIETSARKELNNNKSTDIVSRVPEGLETPKYDVIIKRSLQSSKKSYEIEIRNYSAFSVCSVPMMKARPKNKSQTDQKLSNPQLAGASSFGALAGYLFGKNQEAKSMAMTTPVLTVGDGDEKEMSFVMPSNFWEEGSLDSAPKPMEDSLVELKRKEGGTRAAIMFGGFAGKTEVESRKKQLLQGLESDAEWIKESDDSPITLAQYNDPFTPPWKRRNEVSISVVSRGQ